MLSLAGAEGRFTVLVARPDGFERVLCLDARTSREPGEIRAADEVAAAAKRRESRLERDRRRLERPEA